MLRLLCEQMDNIFSDTCLSERWMYGLCNQSDTARLDTYEYDLNKN